MRNSPGLLLALQVVVGGHQHPGANPFGPVAAQRVVLPLLQQTQQLDLRRGAQIADLVQKEGALGGLFHHPCPRLVGTGKGAFLVAKQGVGKDTVVQPGHIDTDQGAGTAAQLVDRMGDLFLADAAFAGDQHRLAAGRHRFQVLEDGAHPLVLGDDPGKDFGALQGIGEEASAHRLVFQSHLQHAHGPAHPLDQPVLLAGLDEVVVGALTDAADSGLQLVEAADDDHPHVRVLLDDLFEQGFAG